MGEMIMCLILLTQVPFNSSITKKSDLSWFSEMYADVAILAVDHFRSDMLTGTE